MGENTELKFEPRSEEVLHVTRRTDANSTKSQGMSASNENLMVFKKPELILVNNSKDDALTH